LLKVLLLDSPSWKLFSPRLHLHLGILYLAGAVRAAGHDVKVLDCHELTTWDGKELGVKHELLEECDVLGLSATTANVHWGQQLARDWPARVKVLGGPHATHIFEGPHERFKQRRYFEPFDYVFVGEQEQAFTDFLSVLDRGARPESRPAAGQTWFDALGRHSIPAPALPDVSSLQQPAFDLWTSGFAKGALSVNSRNGWQLNANEKMTASLYTARGCPFGCKFCADARTKLREETLSQIEAEVKQLAELGVQAIRIQDDTFTIREDRCKSIADILCHYGMQWRATTRVNLRNPDLFKYMSDKGCTELGFGIEHGSAAMLKAMDKGTTPEMNELGLRMAEDAGIAARAFLMIGFPGETHETIDELRDWILSVRPHMVTLSLFQPFPGSAVWNHPEKFGVELPDAAFDRFWQLGGDDDPDTLVLSLPTISKNDLFRRRKELVEVFENEIGNLDRTRLHGNVGTFGAVKESIKA
jgi:anaerobic magnesium-protoporphyrin IX monomethyl ester cyclase